MTKYFFKNDDSFTEYGHTNVCTLVIPHQKILSLPMSIHKTLALGMASESSVEMGDSESESVNLHCKKGLLLLNKIMMSGEGIACLHTQLI